MADEPERRIVGAIHAELEKQTTDGNIEALGYLNTDGRIVVQGEIDLYLLARAVLAEVKTAVAEEVEQARIAREGTPQTPEQIAAFAKRWDARVEAGRNQ